MINFKKIASLAASAVMVGSTVGLAAAANYPSPFVAGGSPNVGIVYGSSAAITDLVAATNIMDNLNSFVVGGSSGSSTATISGEAYPLFTSSTPIQLNASINSVRSSVTENNLPTVLADTDFTATSDTTTGSSITITHKIEIGSNPRAVFAKEPTTSDDPSIGVLLGTTAANHLYNASATFSKDVNFTDSDTDGEALDLFGKRFTVASATDATSLILFESAEKISLTSDDPSREVTVDGQTYTIELVSASDSAANIRVTDSSGTSDTKEINEAASSKIRGIEVAVDTATETNFQLTATVIIGASRVKFTDGSEVLVGTEEDPVEGTQVNFKGTVPDMKRLSVAVFASSGGDDYFRAGESFVDPVFGGAFKVDFASLVSDGDREDIDISISGNDAMTISFTNWQGKELSSWNWLNNESSAWGRSFLGDSSDWQLFVRESALINESAFTVVGNEDEAFLVELSDLHNSSGTSGQASEYDNDRAIFRNVFDATQTWEADITSEGTGTIDIGGNTYTVDYKDDRAEANDAWVKLNHPDSTGTNDIIAFPAIETGKGSKLIFYEPLLINLSDAHQDTLDTPGTVNADAWKNVTNIKLPDGDGLQNIVVAATPASTGDEAALVYNYTITVGDAGTATEIHTNLSNGAGAARAGGSSADGLIGPLRWNITAANDLDGGGTATAGRSQVWLALEEVDGTVINTPAIVLLEEQDEDNNYNAVIIKTGGGGNSDNGVGVSDVDFTWNSDIDMSASGGSDYGASGLQYEENDKLYSMVDRWGTMVTTDQSTSDQYTSVISYPNNQVTAEVYVADADATITGGSVGGGGGTTVGVPILDSEASSVTGRNMIVVGGSCVNTMAASLLGSSTPLCGADFTAATGASAGQYLIETFSRSGGTVATLVAGYNAGDTTNAGRFLTTQDVSTTVGDKYIGTTGTSATMQTAEA